MQAVIMLSVMAVFLTFTIAELSRNDSDNMTETFKAENVAANIFQYQDSIMQYSMAKYDSLHLMVATNPGYVEQVTIIDYSADQIAKYKQKELVPFLNYRSVIFNFSKQDSFGESQPAIVLYAATSWDDKYMSPAEHGFSGISMPEIMGKFGEDLSKRMYQGDSTYWVVPWVFSQTGCKITELYSQLPGDSSGNSLQDKLNSVFNLFCTQLKNSGYEFGSYVYLSPVYSTPDV